MNHILEFLGGLNEHCLLSFQPADKSSGAEALLFTASSWNWPGSIK